MRIARWTHAVSLTALLGALSGCAADGAGPGGSVLEAADDTTSATAAITASYPVGSTFATTANLNLRSGAGTRYRVIVVMSSGARVLSVDSGPTSGFYHVRYGSTQGWCSGQYLRLVTAATPGGTDAGTGTPPGSSAVDAVFTRAVAGVGFAYWWGHGAWLPEGPTASTQSACYGSCPSCSHGGTYGADCSGYVAKAWQVPSSNSTLSRDAHPYSSGDFLNSTGGGQWSQVSRSSARHGDALVYNNGSAGHIFLVDSGDPWGWVSAYEAPGCASGGGRIHHTTRTATSAYHAIRRAGL